MASLIVVRPLVERGGARHEAANMARKRLTALAALASTICRCCSAAWLRSCAYRRLIARPKLSAVRRAYSAICSLSVSAACSACSSLAAKSRSSRASCAAASRLIISRSRASAARHKDSSTRWL